MDQAQTYSNESVIINYICNANDVFIITYLTLKDEVIENFMDFIFHLLDFAVISQCILSLHHVVQVLSCHIIFTLT